MDTNTGANGRSDDEANPNSAHDQTQWYVLKSQQKFGPYNYDEMIRLRQDRTLFEFDFIWRQGLTMWIPMAQVPEFTRPAIQEYKGRSKVEHVFKKRQAKRVELSVPLMIHNEITLWQGHCHQVSDNGALITMQNPFLLPGDLLVLNFRKSPINGRAFNVKSEIIDKKFSTGRLKFNSPLQYIVKFAQKDPEAADQVTRWINEQKPA